MLAKQKKMSMASRFRGLLPVVVDVETSGLNPATDALLEIAAVTLRLDKNGIIYRDQTFAYQVEAFPGAHIDPEALRVTGIDPGYPLRYAIPEQQALLRLFGKVQELVQEVQCNRAVLVGHNAWFDLSFILQAAQRCQLEKLPFHSFTTFDTATLSAVALGETILARAVREARLEFDVDSAHSAIYDAEKTADLFCYIVNQFSHLA